MATRVPAPEELLGVDELERKLTDLSVQVELNEKPIIPVDYSAKLSPVWSRNGTSSSEIREPFQLEIDDTTQNIFAVDNEGDRIQVFDGKGRHLYQISTPPTPFGLALTEKYIFVSAGTKLVKIKKSSNSCIKSVETENRIWGIDTNSNSDIYGCDYANQSAIVFDRNLKFLKRIKLKTTQINSETLPNTIKLYEDKIYVMFASFVCSPPFHLQVFNQEGKLIRCLIKQSEIDFCNFFSIDQAGNIIVADFAGDQIKIFSKEGNVIHTITTDMLPGDQKISYPRGIAIDKKNIIFVAQWSKKCNLLAF